MNFDQSDYRALVERHGVSTAAAHKPQLEMLAQAAVKADLLTGDPAWDQFLSFLQAARERLQAAADGAMTKLRAPALADPNQVAALRALAMQADAQVAIIDAVMALPGDIKRDGSQAKDLLSRLAGNSEEMEPAA